MSEGIRSGAKDKHLAILSGLSLPEALEDGATHGRVSIVDALERAGEEVDAAGAVSAPRSRARVCKAACERCLLRRAARAKVAMAASGHVCVKTCGDGGCRDSWRRVAAA